MSRASVVTTIDQQHVRDGASFTTAVSDSSMGAGATLEMILSTPAEINGLMHIKLNFDSDRELLVELFEGVTTSDDGVAIGRLNFNRNSANVTGMTAFHTPTITDAGLQIASRLIPTAGNKGTGEVASEREIILMPSTKYHIKVTNQGLTDGLLQIVVRWYDTKFLG